MQFALPGKDCQESKVETILSRGIKLVTSFSVVQNDCSAIIHDLARSVEWSSRIASRRERMCLALGNTHTDPERLPQAEGVLLPFLPDVDVLADAVGHFPRHGQVIRALQCMPMRFVHDLATDTNNTSFGGTTFHG